MTPWPARRAYLACAGSITNAVSLATLPFQPGRIVMQDYNEQYSLTLALNEYLVKATVDYWAALSYPAIFFARYL